MRMLRPCLPRWCRVSNLYSSPAGFRTRHAAPFRASLSEPAIALARLRPRWLRTPRGFIERGHLQHAPGRRSGVPGSTGRSAGRRRIAAVDRRGRLLGPVEHRQHLVEGPRGGQHRVAHFGVDVPAVRAHVHRPVRTPRRSRPWDMMSPDRRVQGDCGLDKAPRAPTARPGAPAARHVTSRERRWRTSRKRSKPSPASVTSSARARARARAPGPAAAS